MIRRPPRSTQSRSSAASDVYKRQGNRLQEIQSNHILREHPTDLVVFMVRQAPIRQLHSNRHCCLWKWPHRKANQSIRRCHPQAKKSASQAVLSRMQLTLHATRRTPHGAPCLVLAMSTWPVKSRRALSRHCRDVRVYGHTTTAVHGVSNPPPLGPRSRSLLCTGQTGKYCLLYTSPSPRDKRQSRMPSSA